MGEHDNFVERHDNVNKLMRELQTRKRLQILQILAGGMLMEAIAIARELAKHCAGISVTLGKTDSKCTAYLQCIGGFRVLRKYGKALYRLLS